MCEGTRRSALYNVSQSEAPHMANSLRTGFILGVALFGGIAGSGQRPSAQTDIKPINDLPGPYRRTVDWAQLPAGMKWAAVIGAEPGPDGNIYVAHRCFANSCAGRSEPPLFKFDASGK